MYLTPLVLPAVLLSLHCYSFALLALTHMYLLYVACPFSTSSCPHLSTKSNCMHHIHHPGPSLLSLCSHLTDSGPSLHFLLCFRLAHSPAAHRLCQDSLYSLLFAWLNEHINQCLCHDDFNTFMASLISLVHKT